MHFTTTTSTSSAASRALALRLCVLAAVAAAVAFAAKPCNVEDRGVDWCPVDELLLRCTPREYYTFEFERDGQRRGVRVTNNSPYRGTLGMAFVGVLRGKPGHFVNTTGDHLHVQYTGRDDPVAVLRVCEAVSSIAQHHQQQQPSLDSTEVGSSQHHHQPPSLDPTEVGSSQHHHHQHQPPQQPPQQPPPPRARTGDGVGVEVGAVLAAGGFALLALLLALALVYALLALRHLLRQQQRHQPHRPTALVPAFYRPLVRCLTASHHSTDRPAAGTLAR